ncbi:hypothetical protein [Bdellovibrio bacteriovorus]|uniref:Flp2 protein n=1 Tax=Bdellovibrio bacteriovorus TaxID=959 RepID=A0A150WCD7_BDEBC|nr:hypothetical protein [Bdellovibrio bacteriovorus]KYG60725.1 hypothetical protein AZI85_12080 [Bdellovibrio bacteriovorus]KYG69071.1 hypothetical protein AZI87_07575 [Bdellovibrio bacteriovorus]
MTVEYVLLLFCVFFFGLKAFLSAPGNAFRNSGPMLGARIEQQIATGDGFKPQGGNHVQWAGDN